MHFLGWARLACVSHHLTTEVRHRAAIVSCRLLAVLNAESTMPLGASLARLVLTAFSRTLARHVVSKAGLRKGGLGHLLQWLRQGPHVAPGIMTGEKPSGRVTWSVRAGPGLLFLTLVPIANSVCVEKIELDGLD